MTQRNRTYLFVGYFAVNEHPCQNILFSLAFPCQGSYISVLFAFGFLPLHWYYPDLPPLTIPDIISLIGENSTGRSISVVSGRVQLN